MNDTHTTESDNSPALSPFDRLAWQAMNVWERLEASTASSGEVEDLPSHPGLRRLIAMWMKALAPDRADLLGRRLRWDGYDELDLVRAVSAEAVTIPSHVRQAVELIGALPEKPASRAILELIPASASIPFAEIWGSFVQAGLTRLGAMPRTIAESAVRDLATQLMTDLQRACGRPMLELFDAARSQAANVDPDGTDLYENFLDNLLGRNLRPFVFQYPLAARRAAELTLLWVDSIRELDARISRDAATIQREFSLPADRVVSVRHLSDRHMGGRRVLRLSFESGLDLIYKPRDLALTAWWSDLLSWCAAQLDAAPPSFRVMAMEGYGWVEPVTTGPAAVEIDLWYERAGALAMLTHLLRGRDLHMENVIASPEGPVVVDAEALLQPELRRELTIVTAIEKGRERLDRSSLATGLLQMEIRDQHGHVHDISGLRGRGGDRSRLPVTAWTRIGKNGIGYESRPAEGLPSENLMEVDGTLLDPAEKIEQISAGFEKMYRFVVENSSGIDQWLAKAGGMACRIVLRPSSQYAATIDRMCEARYSRDGIFETMLCEALNRPAMHAVSRPPGWRLVRGEQMALHRLDIPVVLSEVDAPVEPDSIIAANGVTLSRRMLATLGDADLSEELGLIRGALTRTSGHGFHDGGSDPLRCAAPAVVRDRLLEEVRRIGDRIAGATIRGRDGSSIWMVPALLYQKDRATRGDAFFLYNGLTGIGLFLAALGRIVETRTLLKTGVGAFAPLRQLAADPALPALMRNEPVGGANGIGSIVYGLNVMNDLDPEEGWLEIATTIVSQIEPSMIAHDMRLDLEGGSAGLLLALRGLFTRKSQELSSLAQDRLISTAIERDGAVVWPTGGGTALTGLAHGNAGIALALARSAARDERADELVSRAISYETRALEGGAWRMSDRGPETKINGWCHGAAGIGMSRLAISEELGTDCSHDVERALDAVERSGLGPVDHLCCGNAGRLEFLTEAARHGWERAEELANDLSARMIARAQQEGWRLDSHRDSHASFTMFRGLAGVGWSLLRRIDPALPSILTLSLGGKR